MVLGRQCFIQIINLNMYKIRCLECLARFDNTLVYVRGDKNAVAHAWSRMLTDPSEPVTSLPVDDWPVMLKDEPKTKQPVSFEMYGNK